MIIGIIKLHFLRHILLQKLQLNGKFAYDYTHYLSRDTVQFLQENVTKKMQFDNTYYQQDWYLSAVNMYSILPVWDVSLSVDFQYKKLNAVMRGVGTPYTFPNVIPLGQH